MHLVYFLSGDDPIFIFIYAKCPYVWQCLFHKSYSCVHLKFSLCFHTYIFVHSTCDDIPTWWLQWFRPFKNEEKKLDMEIFPYSVCNFNKYCISNHRTNHVYFAFKRTTISKVIKWLLVAILLGRHILKALHQTFSKI